MKYSQWLGVLAAIALVIANFLAWTWYPDIQETFTGFYSKDNIYGKPGKFFIFLSAVAAVFYLLPKVWAKRWNLLTGCIVLAFAIRTFIVYTACYRGICPVKLPGIWIMLASAALMMVAVLFPDMKLKQQEPAADKSIE